ncbi:glycosyltransferase [Clostridium perfringens]|uniref:glycosyltransferase n=1 Tax=Clostridium perfringens TaxID=1502 RepID=UPI001C854528|nr:glycosyltransferase [Clostridium perfringens]ELC8389845.1 glycosyltransferase [Clostridium perfringens]
MDKQAVKILHFISGFGGGISSYVWNINNSIDNTKVVFDIITFSCESKEFINDIEKKGGKVFVIGRVKDIGIFNFIKTYRSILKENGPYLMTHLHLHGIRALILSIIAKSCNVKRITCHAHIADSINSNKLTQKIKKFFSNKLTVLASSDLAACSKIAAEFVFGKSVVNKGNIVYLPNSIDVNKYMINVNNKQIIDMKNQFGIEYDELIVGHVGYFGYQKNHPFMVNIIKRMNERRIKFKWLFIGEGDDMPYIKELIDKNGCGKSVRFLGRRNDVPILNKIMDVMILPSFFEGLPTVIIEAQASGLPSVVSNRVTEEVDMGLNIIKFLDLDDKIDEWIDSLISMSKVNRLNDEIILNKLNYNGFTSTASAKIYEDFIFNNKKNEVKNEFN